MQRKTDKKNVYNAGKGKANEDLIHLHMSNHYRRILNAKKAVDNSPPYCYKIRRQLACKPIALKSKTSQHFESLVLTDRSISTNSNKESCCGLESSSGCSRYHARCIPEQPNYEPKTKHTCSEVNLVDRITYDTKNGPAAYCDDNWMEQKTSQNFKYTAVETQQNDGMKTSPCIKRQLPTTSNETSQKRKLTVQNKIETSVDVPNPLGTPNCKCTKICICDEGEAVIRKTSFNPKEQSLTSSRDSAYNGGVSSLPESRSPTPDQRRKKECCCCCCEKKQRETKIFEPPKSSEHRIESPRPPLPCVPSALKCKNSEQESFKKMQEDALYVKFIQDITTEILDKNLYTNKALKKVMKKHIKCNIKKLRKDRMLKEVENLRIQLGIPEDKTLLELEVEGEGVALSSSKFYPIISDSEFVMPKSVTLADNKCGSTGSKLSGKMPKSISAVMSACREEREIVSESETDNGDVISVIQMMKSFREKREKGGEKSVCRPNSSDDSDRPSDPKKRSVLKNRKQKYSRSYSPTSSSDSERPECRVSGSKDSYLGEYEQKSSFLNKKNRNVSFWKNPDLNGGRIFEIKHKKTVTKSEESVMKNTTDENKND